MMRVARISECIVLRVFRSPVLCCSGLFLRLRPIRTEGSPFARVAGTIKSGWNCKSGEILKSGKTTKRELIKL